MSLNNIEEDFIVLSNKLQDKIYYEEIANKINTSNIDDSIKLILSKFFYILKIKNFDELNNIINGTDDELKNIQIYAIKIMVIKIDTNNSESKNKLILLNEDISTLIQCINDRNNITTIDENKLFKLNNLQNQINKLLN